MTIFNLLVKFLSFHIFRSSPIETLRTIADEPDIGLNTIELIRRYGYPVESHYITTEDGYILNVHRIPHGRYNNSNSTVENPAILLVHGCMSSSEIFVHMGPEKSLGFILADAGFDVWLANLRGNDWSKNHTFLHPYYDANEFWDFSWHEMGYYDNPAIIDYILKLKGDDNLYYAGFSQGSTALAVTASTRPEYNKKIKLALLLAPAMVFQNIILDYFMEKTLPIMSYLETFANTFNIYEIPYVQSIRSAMMEICVYPENYDICTTDFFTAAGYVDTPQLDKKKLSVIFSTQPSGASIKQYYHFGQVIKRGILCHYDYGEKENFAKYGSIIPPAYNLSMLTAPVVLYYGKKDSLVNYTDVEILAGILPNVVRKYLVPYDLFNHLDFIWSIDVVPLLYNEILQDLKNSVSN